MNFHYKPLPYLVHLLPSDIDGWGIFAKEFIEEGTIIGISHIEDKSGRFQGNYIRTPMGGFINHSEEPNCVLMQDGIYWHLFAQKDILVNYEITLDYLTYPQFGY